MQVRNTTQRWGAVSKLLHWGVVALVIAQFVLANLADGQPLGMAKLGLLARHKSVGITILALALLRLLWRAAQSAAPALPPRLPRAQRWLAQGTHGLLYGLLLAMPLSGWLMSSAKNYPVSWFGLLQLPDLLAPGEALYAAMHEAHEIMAVVLAGTAALHLLGALKHHFVDRDDVLRRMLPFVRGIVPPFALLAGALLAGVTGAAITAQAAAAPSKPATPRATAAPGSVAAPGAPAVRYVVDPANSTLEFRFRQAGATASGRFTRFRATLDWPAAVAATARATPDASTGAVLEVVIDVASVDTADADRDSTLRSAELFAVEHFAQARFLARQLTPTAGSAIATAAGTPLLARGSLQIRDRTRPIDVPLTLRLATESGKRVATLRGELPLKRLDYGVGQGEWQSTQWVDDEVVVRWDLRLQESPSP
jgi:cytochrome b561/polyisoprenoid-binding protein YceI